MALLVAAPAFADHDPRDPEGTCYGMAQITDAWAMYAMMGMPKEFLLGSGAMPTPEDLEDAPEKYRKLIIDGSQKALELVYGEGADPASAAEKFYEWCLPNLPAPESKEQKI